MLSTTANIDRRETLASRAQALRSHADALIAHLRDALLKDLLRRRVVSAVDDVEGFFLDKSVASLLGDDDTCLKNADLVLSAAEVQFVSLSIAMERLIDRETTLPATEPVTGPAMLRLVPPPSQESDDASR
jgi:hypothetical protein